MLLYCKKILLLFVGIYLIAFAKTSISPQLYLIYSVSIFGYLLLAILLRLLSQNTTEILKGNEKYSKYNTAFLLKDIIFILLFAFTIAIHLKVYGFELYKIKQNSMLPNLKPNQLVIVDKLSMGLFLPRFLTNDSIAISSKKLQAWLDKLNIHLQYEDYAILRIPLAMRPLKKKDIIVFYGPEKHGRKLYIKRVIALPGETIQFSKDGAILLDKHKLPEKYLAKQVFNTTLHSNHDGSFIPASVRSKGRVAEKAYISGVPKTFTVPENMYFVLGDNRNSSLDSRNWGFVPIEYIIGRVILTF